MTAYRPRLRAHVRVEDDQLVDGLLDRSFPLTGVVAALAPRLDGQSPWPTIRDGLIADDLDPDDIDASLRGLLCLHLVEGAGDELTARLTAMLAGAAPPPVAVLAGARFACQGSGGCCTGYAFGPLADSDIARLDGLDLAGAFPDLAPPYVEETDGRRFLRRVDGHCLFLGDDRKCRVHGRFGADAKPGFCRMYPLEIFATVDGVRIVDRGTCATFGVSARAGLPMVDEVPQLQTLLEPPSLHHPIAFVDGNPWDYGLYLRFTAAAIALVEQGRATVSETLAAIAALLDGLARAVNTCPLGPGQPDAAATEVLAADVASWYREPDHVTAVFGQRRLVGLLDELAPALAEAIAAGTAQASASRFRELVELTEHIADRIVERQGSAPAPVHPPDVDQALRTSMRQQLFGRRALLAGHAGIGLVRFGLMQLFALAAARMHAGARPLAAADLSAGHSLAARVLESHAVDRVLVQHDGAWRELTLGLAIAMRVVAA